MSLRERQRAFRAEIAAADDDRPPSSLGMAIYRDAYRGRLLAALEASFERTRRWVGAEPFTAAASHYVLAHPPRGWTLDAYGAAFPDLLADLFGDDPEVADLAWLEWHLQQAFAAPDQPRLDPAALAAAGYGADDWERMGFAMAAGFALRPVRTDCATLWEALAPDAPAPRAPQDMPDGTCLLVWRDGLAPRYCLLAAEEAAALAALVQGKAFGTVAAGCDAAVLGGWLARWLGEGVIAAAAPM